MPLGDKGLCQTVIQLQSLLGSRSSFGVHTLFSTLDSQHLPSHRQPRIGRGVAWINLNRTLEVFDGALMVVDDELPKMKTTEQIGLMSRWVDCAGCKHPGSILRSDLD